MIPTLPHLLVRTDNTPNDPTLYVAVCGYVSAEKREFTKDIHCVMCDQCNAKIAEGLKYNGVSIHADTAR